MGQPILGLLSSWFYYPGEFYMVLFNKLSRDKLGLLRVGLINRCVLYLQVFESHEAFAAQILANIRALDSTSWCKRNLDMDGKLGEIPMSKLNSWGGSLALGHPFAATGLRLMSQAMNRLQHEDGQLAVVSSCGQGGQGSCLVLERMN